MMQKQRLHSKDEARILSDSSDDLLSLLLRWYDGETASHSKDEARILSASSDDLLAHNTYLVKQNFTTKLPRTTLGTGRTGAHWH